mmetsp:Transcript_50922/g.129332  ORF Transcript_50922/g.129332 Transcript_50922/m.129332 type:complete len:203 (+) Transcript_50922:54-662(+)
MHANERSSASRRGGPPTCDGAADGAADRAASAALQILGHALQRAAAQLQKQPASEGLDAGTDDGRQARCGCSEALQVRKKAGQVHTSGLLFALRRPAAAGRRLRQADDAAEQKQRLLVAARQDHALRALRAGGVQEERKRPSKRERQRPQRPQDLQHRSTGQRCDGRHGLVDEQLLQEVAFGPEEHRGEVSARGVEEVCPGC